MYRLSCDVCPLYGFEVGTKSLFDCRNSVQGLCLFIPALEHFQSCQKSPSQQDIIQALSTTSLQEVDGELGQMRAELQQVWDMLRERDTELEEHQQELLSARGQVSQHSSEVQRLEQRLTDREQELENKEQALRSLARLRDAERTETQITISSLEMKLAELLEMGIKQTETKGSPECTGNSGSAASDQDALLAELEDMRRRNAQLQEDKDKVVRTLQQLQQRKAERVIPETKREIRPENLDHDKQRRLVTEQLKRLFKEREQHGQACSKLPVALRGSASLQDRSAKSKNAVYTPANQKRGNDEVQQSRDSPPGVTEKVVPAGQQGAPDMSELPGMQEQVARLKEELESKTNKMSAMSVEICNLRERNDSLLTAQMRFKLELQELQEAREADEQGAARLFESSMEEKREPGPFFNVADGTYRVRQVNVGGSEEEEEEEGDEEGEKMRVALGGEAEGTSLQDSWDSFPSSVGTGVISTPLSRTHSVDHLNLPAPSAARTPDQSPLFPRSWAGSQECLFSPRPYRSQADRAFRSVEVYNRAFIFPCVEPEERRHLHEA
ncbi:hypothetical protein GJAV_G00230520 [Gymnothorax javanicus]|nr:hypothetical protein GJAV_G00230520 [Gymnothorax javanicus]